MTNLLTKRTAAKGNQANGRQHMRQMSLLRRVVPSRDMTQPQTAIVKMNLDDPMLENLTVIKVIEAFAVGNKAKATMEVSYKTAQVDDADQLDELASHAPMKMGTSRYETREVELGCGPLRAFLNQRLGQPIQQVEADLHKRCGKKYFMRSTLLRVFNFMVKKNVSIEEDGSIRNLDRSADFNNELTCDFFVHPELGTLEKVTCKCKPATKLLYEQVCVDDEHKLVKLEGLWYMVSFKPIPTMPQREPCLKPIIDDSASSSEPAMVTDVVSKELAYSYHAMAAWGANVYAENKRAACKSELRKHGIRG